MKKVYTEPEITIETFIMEDVITTSGLDRVETPRIPNNPNK